MAKFEQRENSGVLFRNEKKPEGSSQPDYRGEANIDGQVKEIAAWIKKGANSTFMSLSFKDKEEYQPRKESKGGFDDVDDDMDIPF